MSCIKSASSSSSSSSSRLSPYSLNAEPLFFVVLVLVVEVLVPLAERIVSVGDDDWNIDGVCSNSSTMDVSPCSKASACVLDMPGRRDIGFTVVVVLEDADTDGTTVAVDAEEMIGRLSNMDDVKYNEMDVRRIHFRIRCDIWNRRHNEVFPIFEAGFVFASSMISL